MTVASLALRRGRRQRPPLHCHIALCFIIFISLISHTDFDFLPRGRVVVEVGMGVGVDVEMGVGVGVEMGVGVGVEMGVGVGVRMGRGVGAAEGQKGQKLKK